MIARQTRNFCTPREEVTYLDSTVLVVNQFLDHPVAFESWPPKASSLLGQWLLRPSDHTCGDGSSSISSGWRKTHQLTLECICPTLLERYVGMPSRQGFLHIALWAFDINQKGDPHG